MGPTGLLLVYGALFIGVLLTVEALYHLVVEGKHGARSTVNRRLAMLQQGATQQEVLRRLRRHQRDEDGLISRISLLAKFDTLVAQSAVTMTTGRLLSLMALATAGCTGLLTLVGFWWPNALGVAIGFGIVLPVMQLVWRRRRRLRQFGQQLPDALELIVRSLRAGHPLAAAMSVVAQEMADPIGTEFGITEDEATYGLSLPDAIENMAGRVGHEDLHYFVVAIRIQYGTGGNLAEVLSGLAKVIRDRFTMQNKVQAVSAEGRLSAMLLSGMPVVLAGVIMMMNPEYYLSVAGDVLFTPFVYVTLALIVINLLVMRHLVNFKF